MGCLANKKFSIFTKIRVTKSVTKKKKTSLRISKFSVISFRIFLLTRIATGFSAVRKKFGSSLELKSYAGRLVNGQTVGKLGVAKVARTNNAISKPAIGERKKGSPILDSIAKLVSGIIPNDKRIPPKSFRKLAIFFTSHRNSVLFLT